MKSDLTDKEIPEQYLRRTLDGFMIETNIYNKVAHLLRKSHVSLYEVITVDEILTARNNAIKAYSMILRKYAQFNNTRIKEVLQVVFNLEQEHALKLYNKYRCCLNVREHIAIMQILSPLFWTPEDFRLDLNLRDASMNDFMSLYLKDLEVRL
jgi:hypothetical protein